MSEYGYDTAVDSPAEPDVTTSDADVLAAPVAAPVDAGPNPGPAGELDPQPEEPEKKERRPRGWLETDVKSVTDKFVSGEIVMKEGEFLTPHRIANLVRDLDSLDAAPSTGAVAAVLNRWKELGFITTNDKPYAFLDYTEAAKTEGLSALKQARAAERKASRAAAKAAAAPVASAPDAAPAGDDGAGSTDPATDPATV